MYPNKVIVILEKVSAALMCEWLEKKGGDTKIVEKVRKELEISKPTSPKCVICDDILVEKLRKSREHLKVKLYCREIDIASSWVHRETNLLFTLSNDID